MRLLPPPRTGAAAGGLHHFQAAPADAAGNTALRPAPGRGGAEDHAVPAAGACGQAGADCARRAARRMDMGASTLTRNLQPLVAAGWLALGSGPDARSRLVHITPEGVPCAPRPNSSGRPAQLALNDRLGSANVAALHALLDLGLTAFSQPRRPRLRARVGGALRQRVGRQLVYLGQQAGQGTSGGLHQGLAFGGGGGGGVAHRAPGVVVLRLPGQLGAAAPARQTAAPAPARWRQSAARLSCGRARGSAPASCWFRCRPRGCRSGAPRAQTRRSRRARPRR